MKFVDGLMIHSGDPTNDYVDTATRHVLLRQGVLGIKVSVTYTLSLYSLLEWNKSQYQSRLLAARCVLNNAKDPLSHPAPVPTTGGRDNALPHKSSFLLRSQEKDGYSQVGLFYLLHVYPLGMQYTT